MRNLSNVPFEPEEESDLEYMRRRPYYRPYYPDVKRTDRTTHRVEMLTPIAQPPGALSRLWLRVRTRLSRDRQ